jgi:hypothetical protein
VPEQVSMPPLILGNSKGLFDRQHQWAHESDTQLCRYLFEKVNLLVSEYNRQSSESGQHIMECQLQAFRELAYRCPMFQLPQFFQGFLQYGQ